MLYASERHCKPHCILHRARPRCTDVPCLFSHFCHFRRILAILVKPLFPPSLSPVLPPCARRSKTGTVPGPAALGTAPHATALLLAPTGHGGARCTPQQPAQQQHKHKQNRPQNSRDVCQSPPEPMHAAVAGAVTWRAGLAGWDRLRRRTPQARGPPCFPNARLGGSGWHGGSGCSVVAGSCCRAPDLAHASSLAVNPWERRNPEQGQQRLLAAKRLREPARAWVTPGRPAASPSPATFMGAGQSGARGPAERWWGTDSGRHLAPGPWPPQGPP